MILDTTTVKALGAAYGDAFYLLESEQFRTNFAELSAAFKKQYPNFAIAYSYKTNYTPALCAIVDELGGYAEVVSDMELEIALRIGVEPSKIIWNGPVKNSAAVERLLLAGGTVNLDSECEIEPLRAIAKKASSPVSVGVRCNFDIGDGVTSRFGFDTGSAAFRRALDVINSEPNIELAGLQCHFAVRSLETWVTRTEGMLALIDSLGIVPKHIDLGGGLYGKMADSLKAQFGSYIPDYAEYAKAAAARVAERFKALPDGQKPLLLIEPGSALVGDCMRFAAKVVNIKSVRGKSIATVLGSMYNINPTLNKKNPPVSVLATGKDRAKYTDLDIGGFTCIESDYLYRGYTGELGVGDYVVFGNVGSYSVVLKPPFILPNFPVIDICGAEPKLIKRAETFDDLFRSFGI